MPKQSVEKTIVEILLCVVIAYIVLAWGRFAILHPKAGDGAFYVYFEKVMTWQEVPELQEE